MMSILNLKPYIEELFKTGFVEISYGIEWHASTLVQSVKNITEKIITYDKSIVDGFPEIICFKIDGNLGDMELDWHQDSAYFKNNYYGALLYNFQQGAEILPTFFVDSCKVIDELSEDFKNKLRNSFVTWNFATHLNSLSEEQKNNSYSQKFIKLVNRGLISNTSKILVKHPKSKKEVLYISPGTISKCDLTNDELNYLIDLFEKYSFEVIWKPNQLIMFDNYRFLHKRNKLDKVKHANRELRAIRFNYLEIN